MTSSPLVSLCSRPGHVRTLGSCHRNAPTAIDKAIQQHCGMFIGNFIYCHGNKVLTLVGEMDQPLMGAGV